MRRELVAGNWKMNGGLEPNAGLLGRLASEWTEAEPRAMAVLVPAPYFAQTQAALDGSSVEWGAQDVSEHRSGAYTGEVSAAMVAEFGCRYAIVGHSERRQLHAETDAVVAAKARAALHAGLTPIACVGETLAERERGETAAIVHRQLAAVIAALGDDTPHLVVAYEPVWAIGTGHTATPEIAQETHAFIKTLIDVPVVYGGSVKASNASGLFAMPDIDGALVGGASLDADEFLAIGRA